MNGWVLALALGAPIDADTSYYGASSVGFVDVCHESQISVCYRHISKLGRDNCGLDKCYGDNWLTVGVKFKLFQ